MQLANTPHGYGAIAKAFHWAVVVLVVAGWALGTFGEELPRGAGRDLAFFIHVSAGLLVLALFLPRIVWRVVDAPPPPEPMPFGRWPERFAAVAHYALYALVLAVPLAGIAAQFSRGEALPVLGLVTVASPMTAVRATARSVKEVHEVLANALFILALLHAAAALFHHWILRDRTLIRMLPGR